MYALICVNLFALSFVILAQYKTVDRFAVTAFAGFMGALISFFFVVDFNINTNTLLILLLAGALVSPLSRVLIGIGTKQLPASEVSILFIIETVMAPIWVWLVLNEVPSNSTFIGGGIILTTLLINSIYILKYTKDNK